MTFNNPLEILLSIILVLGSIWLIERIIRGAFKTVAAIIIILLILGTYSYLNKSDLDKKNQAHFKYQKLPKFETRDFTDYDLFQKKFKVYEDNTINDLKFDYQQIKKNK